VTLHLHAALNIVWQPVAGTQQCQYSLGSHATQQGSCGLNTGNSASDIACAGRLCV